MNSATEPIELIFAYTEAEYVAAAHDYYSRTFHLKTFLIASVLLIAAGLSLWLYSGEPVALFGLAVFTLIVGTPLIFYYVTPRRRFRQYPQLHQPYRLLFSEEAITFNTRNVESRLEWQLYQSARETERFYLLSYGKGLFTFIPKRVFNDETQERHFRALIGRKMKAEWA